MTATVSARSMSSAEASSVLKSDTGDILESEVMRGTAAVARGDETRRGVVIYYYSTSG